MPSPLSWGTSHNGTPLHNETYNFSEKSQGYIVAPTTLNTKVFFSISLYEVKLVISIRFHGLGHTVGTLAHPLLDVWPLFNWITSLCLSFLPSKCGESTTYLSGGGLAEIVHARFLVEGLWHSGCSINAVVTKFTFARWLCSKGFRNNCEMCDAVSLGICEQLSHTYVRIFLINRTLDGSTAC